MNRGTDERPRLSRALFRSPGFAGRADPSLPDPALLNLPERVLVFGTGVFVRGFVADIIEQANRGHNFNGRIVLVGSTGSGREEGLKAQDCLYTLAICGGTDGAAERYRLIGSVSRALDAGKDWESVLECARDPNLRVVFSNTTEVGIALDESDAPDLTPPRSFPGKLTRFLFERGSSVGWQSDGPLLVVPCELVDDNGDRLREIVLLLARRWYNDCAFSDWLESAVSFCNTLVDRIVAGVPGDADRTPIERTLGYRDDMLTVCEPHRFLAIEVPDGLRNAFGFARENPGVLLTRDVKPYRDRKLLLLNGAHTILTPLALLLGHDTVQAALQDAALGRFVRQALFDETVPGLNVPGALEFAQDVLVRFANPAIHHALLDITLQQTAKMRARVVPTVVRHIERTGKPPAALALGFAAYLFLLRDGAARRRDDAAWPIQELWKSELRMDIPALVGACLSDAAVWGVDLAAAGFADAVAVQLTRIATGGARAALDAHLLEAHEVA